MSALNAIDRNAEARERVKKFYAKGLIVEADDLTEEIEIVELVAEFRALIFPKREWECLVETYGKLLALNLGHMIPFLTKLHASLKYMRSFFDKREYRQWAMHAMPSLALSPEGGWSMAHPQAGGLMKLLLPLVAKEETDLEDKKPLEVQEMDPETDVDGERGGDAAVIQPTDLVAFMELMIEVLTCNAVFVLIENLTTTSGEDLIAARKQLLELVSVYCDTATQWGTVPHESFSFVDKCLRIYKGLRALLDPRPGIFNNTKAEDVAWLVPSEVKIGGKSTDDSLPSLGPEFKSAKAISRLLTRSDFWKMAVKDFKDHMGADSSRGGDLSEYRDLVETLIMRITKVEEYLDKQAKAPPTSGSSELDVNMKQEIHGIFSDEAEFFEHWKEEALGHMEALRRGALDLFHARVGNMMCRSIAIFNQASIVNDSKFNVKAFLADGMTVAQMIGDTALYQILNDDLMAVNCATAQSVLLTAMSKIDTLEEIRGAHEAYLQVKDVETRSAEEVDRFQALLARCRAMIASESEKDAMNDPRAAETVKEAKQIIKVFLQEGSLQGLDAGEHDKKFLDFADSLHQLYVAQDKSKVAIDTRKLDVMKIANAGYMKSRALWGKKSILVKDWPPAWQTYVKQMTEFGGSVLQEGDQRLKSYCESLYDQHRKSITSKMEDLSPIAGGLTADDAAPAGTRWTNSLKKGDSSDVVIALFKKTIGSPSFNGPAIDKHTVRLQQVPSHPRLCCSNLHKMSLSCLVCAILNSDR